ncbi:MAG: geranylgeranyl diphosphate synthase type II [Psychromonas sp.]|jgi:geranylgeranyl diphosphate synthase type II
MDKIKEFSSVIEEAVQTYNWPSSPKNLYEPLSYFLDLGGKRMRPILTLMSAEMFGSEPKDILPLAMGIELFHNFTLIHDDIMDAAPLRRAQQTVHLKWDENIAILSGDVLMVKAYQEICKVKSIDLSELLACFNKTAVEVCEGQQMDMDFESRDDVSIPEYIEMIRLKTSVLLGCALELGAIKSGASISDRQNIYLFGQELGLAFQIKDDLLDLYGDPEKVGKQIGGDVISNKKTLLLLLAQKTANQSQLENLESLLQEKDHGVKVNKVRLLFDELNIRNQAKSYIDLHYKNAKIALDAISVVDEKKKDLKDLSIYLMNREY